MFEFEGSLSTLILHCLLSQLDEIPNLSTMCFAVRPGIVLVTCSHSALRGGLPQSVLAEGSLDELRLLFGERHPFPFRPGLFSR